MAISYPLSLPAAPAFSQLRLTARSVVGVSRSPFTGQQQVQEHAGQWWEIEARIPPMARAAAEQWVAFLLKLKGMKGTFLLGDIVGAVPRGTIAGSPAVDGAHAARSATLALKGLTVGTTLLAGDYFQVGSGTTTRLHKNLSDATADGSGEMTLDIWPSLREALSDSAAVTVTNCKGTFRLSSNETPWDIGSAQFYGIALGAIEAL